MTKTVKKTNPVIELLLCLFLGHLGAHRFYRRKYGTAILYLCTMGLFAIGWLIDLVLIIVRLLKQSKSEPHESEIPADILETSLSNTPVATQTVQDESPRSPVLSTTGPDPDLSTVADTKIKKYKVAGVTHYEGNILNLAYENPDYDMNKRDLIDAGMTDEKVWKYEFNPSEVELVPEPDNPNDPNAIKVLVDGEHVGYIKSGSCAHIRKILKNNGIQNIDCIIGGGPYKLLYEDYDYEKDKDVYVLEKGDVNLFVHLEITEDN